MMLSKRTFSTVKNLSNQKSMLSNEFNHMSTFESFCFYPIAFTKTFFVSWFSSIKNKLIK